MSIMKIMVVLNEETRSHLAEDLLAGSLAIGRLPTYGPVLSENTRGWLIGVISRAIFGALMSVPCA